MLIRQIWDYFNLALCAIAVVAAILVFCTNPQRPLNQFLACFLTSMSSAEVLQLVGLNYRNLTCLRYAHVFAGLALVSAGLIHDAILHPCSPFRPRLRRKARYLILASLIFVFPLTEWWLLQRSTPTIRAFFFGYLGLRVILAAWLLLVAFETLRKASPERRFDAQNFCALTFFFFLAVIFGLVARIFYVRDALRWMEVIVGAYYPLLAWMMTSSRLYTVGELTRSCLRFIACLIFPLAVVLPLLGFAGHLPAFWLALALVASAYAAMLLGSFTASLLLDRFPNSSRDQAKAAMNALTGVEWSENGLQERFCAIVGAFLGQAQAEAFLLESLLENSLTPSRRLLAQKAEKPGWLTIHSAQRRTEAREIKAVQQAFNADNLSLVLVSSDEANRCVLFVGQVSSLKIITYPVIAFLAELLAMYQFARQRLSLAHKAIYNDRLASAGFIASQMSHEARNRLDSIRVALELLKAGEERQITFEHRALLLQELEAFLMDFTIGLDMARADIGRITATDGHGIVDEVVTIFAPYAQSFGIQVQAAFLHKTDLILADRRLLRQALFNLLRNAAEALHSTPKPQIRLHTTNSEQNFHIDVIDNGPGVASGQYDRLFVEFSTTKDTGTGLGLSLCRDVMALMKGSIHYVTPRGKPNACFRLSIPLARISKPPGTSLAAMAETA